MILKNIKDLPSVISSHNSGQKQVLLSKEETDTKISQVAVITLMKGEIGDAHIHWGIEECFYVLCGEMYLIQNEQRVLMKEGDFAKLPMGTKHNLEAISDVKVLSIGCNL